MREVRAESEISKEKLSKEKEGIPYLVIDIQVDR